MLKKKKIKKSIFLLISAFSCVTSQAQEEKNLPSFETQGCEIIKGFDPDWNSYGDEYGLKLTPKKDFDYIFGFYQMIEKDRKLYAAFGGAVGPNGPVKGARPGAVIVLDANTLDYEKAIALPFHAHAMTLDARNNRLIVTHTSANAFSIIDLNQDKVICLKPETNLGEISFRGRYIQSDENGNFYINYNTIENGEGKSIIVKYDKNGKKDSTFDSKSIENNVAFPLFYRNNTLFAGSKGVKSVSAQTGEVKTLSETDKDRNLFNYVSGPRNTLLATDMNKQGNPGLYLFDLTDNTSSSLFTGTASLELAYKQEAAQVLVSNLESKTVSVIELSEDEKSLENKPFLNIQISKDVDFFFRGIVNNIYLRQDTKNTEFFITQKFWADKNTEKHGLISKVTLADFVHGIEGFEKPNACTIQTFNIADRSVSKKETCIILDEKQTYEAEIDRFQKTIEYLDKEKKKNEENLKIVNSDIEKYTKSDNKELIEKARAEKRKLEEYKSAIETDIPKSAEAIKAMQDLLNKKT